MVETLETLINFKPVTSNQDAVSELLSYIEGRLTNHGLYIERHTINGVHSLYASTHGGTHTKVMLQGHIDVVPGGETFIREGDKIRGRGCYDMLFATASFIRLIDELDDPSKYDLSILVTGDEEHGGKNGVGALMQQSKYTCDICILPDAGEQLGTMSIGAKGVMQLEIRLDGTSHHASRPWEGDGAAGKLIQFLDEFSNTFDTTSRANSTLTISRLQAGNEALNQGPEIARAGVDIRYTDKEDLQRIRDSLSHLQKKYNVTIENEHAASDFNLNFNHPLVQKFTQIYESSLGEPVKQIRAYGSSDARFFDEKNIPVIMFRPDGSGAHSDYEWISIESWNKFHDILDRFVQETAVTQ